MSGLVYIRRDDLEELYYGYILDGSLAVGIDQKVLKRVQAILEFDEVDDE